MTASRVKTPRGAVGDIDNAVLPPPAPETRETILSAHDVEVMCWHAEGSTRKCEIGPHGTVEPESGEAIGYCGKCGWAAPLQRLAQSHEALRAALATERAARIAVEQCELCRCDADHKRHGRATLCDYHYQLSRDECAELLERAEQAEASLAEMTTERDALRTALERFMSATLMPTPTKPIILARREASKVLAAGPQGDR